MAFLQVELSASGLVDFWNLLNLVPFEREHQQQPKLCEKVMETCIPGLRSEISTCHWGGGRTWWARTRPRGRASLAGRRPTAFERRIWGERGCCNFLGSYECYRLPKKKIKNWNFSCPCSASRRVSSRCSPAWEGIRSRRRRARGRLRGSFGRGKRGPIPNQAW